MSAAADKIQQDLDFLRGSIGRLSRLVEALESSPIIRKVLCPPAQPAPQRPLAAPGAILSMAEVERRAIFEAVLATGDTQTAARALGIGKTTIYRKLRGYERAGYTLPPLARAQQKGFPEVPDVCT